MADLKLPQPKDVRQSQRTGFSFARWAIPELCQFKGRAIYLDADMIVFRDIADLWNVPLNGSKIAVLEPQHAGHANVHRGKNETSVMVLDCGSCDWTVAGLVAGLDGKYTYSELMRDLCFLSDAEIARTIPLEWNGMEEWTPQSGLLHYTIMPTQPWVSARNPLAYLWIAEVRRMIGEGALTRDDIKREVELGYFRPSLLIEIDEGLDVANDSKRIETLEAIDRGSGYVPHREAQAWERSRQQAIRTYQRSIARQAGPISYLSAVARDAMSAGRVLAGRVKRRLAGH